MVGQQQIVMKTTELSRAWQEKIASLLIYLKGSLMKGLEKLNLRLLPYELLPLQHYTPTISS